MKKIECEACGSNDLLKQGDYFVCQNCGCKYTVEDVRKMMIEGTVEVKGTVSIDTSNKEQALLDYCEASYKNNLRSDLNQNAMKLLEINPKLWQGWFYRGVCNEVEITSVNNVMEPKMAITFYNQAFELAKGEDKKKLADTLYPRLTSLILKRFNYIFHSKYNYKINVEKLMPLLMKYINFLKIIKKDIVQIIFLLMKQNLRYQFLISTI